MRIGITGASGFVGQHLITRFRQTDHEVVEIARRGEATDDSHRRIIRDPWDGDAWAEVLRDIEIVVHLIGRAHHTSDGAEARDAYMRANVGVTRALILGAQHPQHIIYLSSIKAVAEESGISPICDETAAIPTTAYGESKLLAEQELSQWADTGNNKVTVLRPPLIYGPGVRGNLGPLMRAADSAVPLPFGGFHNRRSLLSVSNLSDAVVAATVRRSTASLTLVISDSGAVSTTQLVEALRTGFGRPRRLYSVPERVLRSLSTVVNRREQFRRLVGNLEIDSTRAHLKLGWMPRVETVAGLRELARNVRE